MNIFSIIIYSNKSVITKRNDEAIAPEQYLGNSL
jgi:hypothetical protein